MKRLLILSIAVLLALGTCFVTVSAAEAVPAASTVFVNGEIVAFDAYNIDGSNYFKLRDLAYILNGTQKQFEVGWNGVENAISLTSGKPYTAVGGEMDGKGDGIKTPVPTSSKILLDGKEVQFTAYNIEGNNYFKLRDIGAAIDFGVDWDGEKNAIAIDTGKIYMPDVSEVRIAAGKIKRLADTFNDLNVYCAIIPDKSIYSGQPKFDMKAAQTAMGDELGGITQIDLTNALKADDFYNTDLHWKQTNLTGVLNTLGNSMGFSERLNTNFTEHTAGSFLGVQAQESQEPDIMTYLTNPVIDAAAVRYLNDRTFQLEDGPMYDPEAFKNPDPYDLFLRGAKPVIEIINPAADTEKELYLFRDSFSSSLAPLLTSAYSRIVLIDLRYVDSRILPQLVEFKPGSDVLFLYGIQILQNASVLLTP